MRDELGNVRGQLQTAQATIATLQAQTPDDEEIADLVGVVSFEPNRFDIDPRAEGALREIADSLRSLEALSPGSVRVEGYADSRGPADNNVVLAALRARAVYAALFPEFGDALALLSAPISLGESRLPVPTGDDVSEARNRVVHVYLANPR